MRHRALSALVLGLTVPLALTACGGDDPEASPLSQASSDAAATATDTPTVDPSATESGDPDPSTPTDTFDDQGHESFAGAVTVDNAQQQAVADAWFAYWQVRADAYGTAEVDPTELGAVASGDAAEVVVGYVDYLKKNDLKTVGDTMLSVSKVRISGKVAGLQSCMRNKSVDRDADGNAVEDLTKYYTITGVLARQGSGWIVTNSITNNDDKCSVR